MRVRRTDLEFAATRDKNVSLLAQSITQFRARLGRLNIAWYLYVIVLAFIVSGQGNVRQDTFGVHAAVT